MNTVDDDILLLNNQLKDWSIQIAVLAAKQEAAAATARQFAQELTALRAKHLGAARQLKELELHKSGMYMWENIGDGG
jgi:C4-dicarboxylate-specific signal transduction histidine kinase